jgi:hypothetical protein
VSFYVNQGPVDGTLTVQPISGNELNEDFTLTMSGWDDYEKTDYPLTVTFYQIESNGIET